MNGPAVKLAELLRAARPRLTLAVAESMTGGRVQALVTAVSGASEYFAGGVTAYAREQKVALLGVDDAHAAAVNCVSERVVGEMAIGVCRLFKAGVGVATTGYAEPAPAGGVAVPFVWLAVARRAGGELAVVARRRVEFPGATRAGAQDRAAAAAVELLVESLLGRDDVAAR
jgi:nicotinamide-nucleotide amidase